MIVHNKKKKKQHLGITVLQFIDTIKEKLVFNNISETKYSEFSKLC